MKHINVVAIAPGTWETSRDQNPSVKIESTSDSGVVKVTIGDASTRVIVSNLIDALRAADNT